MNKEALYNLNAISRQNHGLFVLLGRYVFIGILFLLSFAHNASALPLNQAHIVVADRSKKALNSALLQAYAEVMVKQSGNPKVMTVPQLQNSLSKIHDYVQHYRYSNDQDNLLLEVTFDNHGLHALLAKAGQAVWLEKQRPLTLVIINNLSTQNIANRMLAKPLHETAERYGLRILLAAMDLSDQADIEKLTPQALTHLSQRYGVHNILCGTITENTAQAVQIQWQWWQNWFKQQWPTSDSHLASAIDAGMQQFLEILANQYATFTSQAMQSHILLRISHITNLGDYTNVLSALQHLPAVSHVKVDKMNPNEVLLSVSVAGGTPALIQMLKDNRHFILYRNDKANTSMVELHYGWQSLSEQVNK